jgi:hypothetical protein
MSTDVDRTNYKTETTDLPASIESGRPGIRFLRIIQFAYPASPLAIIRYERDGVEQHYGMRLDLDKFAFLDHYADEPQQWETESKAARQIVMFLAAKLQAARSQAAQFQTRAAFSD